MSSELTNWKTDMNLSRRYLYIYQQPLEFGLRFINYSLNLKNIPVFPLKGGWEGGHRRNDKTCPLFANYDFLSFVVKLKSCQDESK